MIKSHIKKGDTVYVLAGDDRGATGRVLAIDRTKGRAIVEGCNMVTKHVKAKRQDQLSGIVKAEGALYACKVMPVCPKCKKATRVGNEVKDDKKVRVCKHCGAEL